MSRCVVAKWAGELWLRRGKPCSIDADDLMSNQRATTAQTDRLLAGPDAAVAARIAAVRSASELNAMKSFENGNSL